MKTFSTKYCYRAAARFLSAVLTAAALASCSSDSEPIPEVEPAGNGMATINLAFSAPSIQTRGDNDGIATQALDKLGDYDIVDAKAEEDKVNNLWVYLFLKGDNGTYSLYRSYEIVDKNTNKNPSSNGEILINPGTVSTNKAETIIEKLNVVKGDYHIYVLANMKAYTVKSGSKSIQPSTTLDISEDDLLKATFDTNKHSDNDDRHGVIKGALPMAAYYTDVTVDATSKNNGNASDTGGTISIKSGSITIEASMTYLCSKVRYTFFFDNRDSVQVYNEDGTPKKENNQDVYSAGFSYPYKTFQYQSMGVHNAMQNAAIYPVDFNGTLSQLKGEIVLIDDPKDQTLGCVWSNFPEKGVEAWAKPSTTTFIPPSLGAMVTLGEGEKFDPSIVPTTGELAYQGIVYLSENKSGSGTENANVEDADDNNRTYLHLKVKLDGKDMDYKLFLPNETGTDYLQHGTFYDIIAKITATGLQFNVKVKKWVKSDNNPDPIPL